MIYLAANTKRFKCFDPKKGMLIGRVSLDLARLFIASQGEFTPVFETNIESSDAFLHLKMGVGHKVTPLFVPEGCTIYLKEGDVIMLLTPNKDEFRVLMVTSLLEVSCGKALH